MVEVANDRRTAGMSDGIPELGHVDDQVEGKTGDANRERWTRTGTAASASE